jgi:cleavage stimulation factor subunit 3
MGPVPGVFPPPPTVGDLLARLPPPSSYEGPFVNVDDLMNIIMECRLQEPASALTGIVNSYDTVFRTCFIQ